MTKKIYRVFYNSELGLIEITGNETGILTIDFADRKDIKPHEILDNTLPSYLTECLNQLDEYFKGKRKVFELPLITTGTPFQKKVWERLIKIPYGKTFSYKDIAEQSGNVKAVRAVGNANNRNKIAVVIPCHRVIGSNKSLTGYAGGLWRKEWLINHERSFADKI